MRERGNQNVSGITLPDLFNSLPYSACILNKNKVIEKVNKNWEEFICENGLVLRECGPGTSYIKLIKRITKKDISIYKRLTTGIKAVLSGEKDKFSISDCYYSFKKNSKFKIKITSLKDKLLIIHEHITDQKVKADKELKDQLKKLTAEDEAIFNSIGEEFKIQKSNDYYWADAFFENNTSAVAILDEENCVSKVNEEFQNEFGYKLEEIKGRSLGEVLGKEGSPIEMKSQEISDEEEFQIEGTCCSKFGKVKEFLIKRIPITIKNKIKGAYIIYHDITELKREKEKLAAIFQACQDVSFIISELDTSGTNLLIKEFSPGAENIFSYKKEEVLNKPITILYSSKDRKKVPLIYQNAAAGRIWKGEVELVRQSGEKFPALLTLYPIEMRENKSRILGVSIDISDLKEAQKELEIRKKQYQKIFNKSLVGMMLEDSKGNILKVNDALCRITGYSREELEGNDIFDTIVPEERREKAKEDIQKLLTGEDLEFSVRSQKKEGDYYHVHLKETKFQLPNGEEGILSMQLDITDFKEREKELEYISFHDELTDLYNRSYMEEEIKRLDVERKLPISLIMIDVNGLKIINDTYGHEKGDELLKRVANLLTSCVRSEDIVARWAGDEFLILLPQTNNQEAEKICQRIKNKCAATKSENIPVSLGVGKAVKTESEQDIYEVLQTADNRMYQNKLTERRSSQNKLVRNLLKTLGAKSGETEKHVFRVTNLALKLGEKINLSEDRLSKLSLLAPLHDIGKVTIPEEVLKKPEGLTKDEWEIIKKHPETGFRLASATEEFAPIAKHILGHHERWDGKGYPQGLEGEDIPLLARIMAVVDAYDVMVEGRSYKEAVSKEEALAELKRNAGSQFDPELVEEFVEIIKNKL